MSRKLPPLNALRAFEAAGRLHSVSRAAAELSVTQSAVSHQIKTLEDWTGQTLAERRGRGIALTQAGETYRTALTSAFDALDAATRRLQEAGSRQGWLTVAMMPSFAAKWLVPRLPGFRAARPEIDVWIATWWNFTGEAALSAFADSDVDLAIVYGPGGWANVSATRFMTEDLFPVCAPAYRTQHRLRTPADLKRATLLHDEMRQDWRLWLQMAGVSGVDPEPGPGFDDSGLLIQAAMAGMGVALGRSALVKADLEAGLLVQPFTPVLHAEWAYYVVCRPGTERLPKVAAFRDWLMQAA